MNDNVAAIKERLIRPKKVQLHSGMPGFNSPDAYGIYRNTGGDALGVVGRVYEPPDLSLFVDLITKSIEDCADFLNLDDLEYMEMKEGSKVRISIAGPKLEIKSPMVGDIIQTRLDFITGFDGLTKTSLSSFLNRIWCGNGCANWVKGINLAFKNTPGNQGKWLLFCDQIVKALEDTTRYQESMGIIAERTYTKAERDAFFVNLLGYSEADYKEITTRKRNILDKINASVAIEEQNTGSNLFGLVQGVTRYTTHELAGGDMDLLLDNNPAKLNAKAHKSAFALVGVN